jgi:hypothetical protein
VDGSSLNPVTTESEMMKIKRSKRKSTRRAMFCPMVVDNSP